jgi:hypothetical protein
MDKHSNRFVAVNLTDAEWRALRAITPDPCAWMKTQIQRLLDESGARSPCGMSRRRRGRPRASLGSGQRFRHSKAADRRGQRRAVVAALCRPKAPKRPPPSEAGGNSLC